jgi:hypothetical protein
MVEPSNMAAIGFTYEGGGGGGGGKGILSLFSWLVISNYSCFVIRDLKKYHSVNRD